MINRTHRLPLLRKCRSWILARSTAYYQPRPVSPAGLALMHRIDDLHLAYPFAVSTMQATMLKREGTPVGRRHVSTPDEADGHPLPVSQAQLPAHDFRRIRCIPPPP